MSDKGTTVVSGGKDSKVTPQVDTRKTKRLKKIVNFEPKIQEEQRLYHQSLWTVAKKHPTLGLKVVKRFPSKTEADYYAKRMGENHTVVKPTSELFKSSLTSADFQLRTSK